MSSKSDLAVPIWEKYTLSIEEAATYFRVGEQKLRSYVEGNHDAKWVLMNGTRTQIKRKLFEEHIDSINVI